MSINICGAGDVPFAVCCPLAQESDYYQCNQGKNREAVYGVSRFKSLFDLPYLWLITRPAAVTPCQLSQCQRLQTLGRQILGNVLRRGGYTLVFRGCGGGAIESKSPLWQQA